MSALQIAVILAVLGGTAAAMALLAFRTRCAVRDLWKYVGRLEAELRDLRADQVRQVANLWGATAAHVKDRASVVRFTSQGGEDHAVWRMTGFRRQGYFVDVGAFDGVSFSNSFGLEQLGWRGILIDANPHACERARALRPQGTIVHAAVGGSEAAGETEFFLATGYAGVEMLSSTIVNDMHRARLEREGASTEIIRVPYRSLSAILAEHRAPAIDLLSVDVEGQELTILQGLDWERWRPRLVVVEANDRSVLDFLASRDVLLVETIGANWLLRARDYTPS